MAFPVGPTNGQIYTDSTTNLSYVYNSATNAWVRTPSSSAPKQEVKTITVNGQTAFNTLAAPTDVSRSLMNVNGVDYFQPDYTVVGTTFTWAGPFTLETSDKLVILYV